MTQADLARKMNSEHTYQVTNSNWEISPPLPTIQRFPSPPSYSHSPNSDSSSTSYPSTRFNFGFDFDFGTDFGSYSHSASPISKPGPLVSPRKAPLPPVYSPRRARARHIRMQEPAKLGLFTVSESDEEVLGESSTSSTWYSDLTIALSTPTASPYLSASSSTSSFKSGLSESESEAEVETPSTEYDDPFSTPPTTLPILDWSNSPSYSHSPRPPPPTPRTAVPTLAAAVNAGTYQPRRPPPLALHLITRPRDLPSLDFTSAPSPSPLSFHCQLSAGGTPLVPPLAPALLIRPSSTSTPQKRRSPDTEVDLVSALEELFTSCGEDLSDVDVDVDGSSSRSVSVGLGLDQFPLPPSRSIPSISISTSTSRPKIKSRSSSPLSTTPTPVSATSTYLQTPTTPPPNRHQLSPSHNEPPPAPRQKQRRMTNTNTTTNRVQFQGDHSFLMDMARSPSGASSRSGSSSGSSSRGLPRRSSIPTQWIGNPI